MSIPKILKPKFDANICTMCDRGINQHRDHDSRLKYLDTGYCQQCIDLEFGDLPNQGLTSIDWEKCLRKVLVAMDYDVAVNAIQASGLSVEDREELLTIIGG